MIRTGTIEEVVAISKAIPEFIDPPGSEVYEKRILEVPHLILVAEEDEKLVGFKVGYERDGSFYSWMGGVLPDYRRLGIAQKLADTQEKWAKSQGYTTILFKTRNHHKGMLIFALKNGFNIVGFKERESIDVHRILLQKSL